jgi:hypothetical protein
MSRGTVGNGSHYQREKAHPRELNLVVSPSHLMTTRANIRRAHEEQQEKALWEEEHGAAGSAIMTATLLHKPPCNGCVNGGGKFDLYKRRQKKNKRRIR